MDVDTITSLGRESMKLALLIGSPLLIVGLLIGLVVGTMQSVTQIQDQTVAFVLKLLAIFATLAATLPWIVTKTVEFSQNTIANIPETLTLFLE